MIRQDFPRLPSKNLSQYLRIFILCFCNKNPVFRKEMKSMDKLEFPGLAPDSAASRFFRHPPVLESPRLTLRPLRMSDAKSIYAWTSDPEVARFVLWDAHCSIRETRDYIRYVRHLYRHRLPSSWGISLRDSDNIIGTIGIMAYIPPYRTCEIGYSLSHEYWGQGIMTEAVSLLTRSLFTALPLNRIEAQHDVRNPASGRVLEKCAFQKEGILRSRIINKNEPIDVVLWSLLKKDIP